MIKHNGVICELHSSCKKELSISCMHSVPHPSGHQCNNKRCGGECRHFDLCIRPIDTSRFYIIFKYESKSMYVLTQYIHKYDYKFHDLCGAGNIYESYNVALNRVKDFYNYYGILYGIFADEPFFSNDDFLLM